MTLNRVWSVLLLVVLTAFSQGVRGEPDVTRATLDNGLRVVIVRDPLAPVVTVYDNYLVGGDETPAGFPGMAHAQEHMAFRGCAGVTADQTAAIFAQLGAVGWGGAGRRRPQGHEGRGPRVSAGLGGAPRDRRPARSRGPLRVRLRNRPAR